MNSINKYRWLISAAVLISVLGVTGCRLASLKKTSAGYPVLPVPFTEVRLTDNFWSKRIETNRNVTIPYAIRKCREEGRIRNFARAGGLLEGDYEGKMPFDDSDVYKLLEGISYSLQTHPDPALETLADGIIDTIAAAQEPDGYLCTWKTLDPDTTPAWWVKPGPRWFNLSASHELYNAGHLYEAAFAHYQATGRRNLLDIALKNADLVASVFGPGKNMEPPGHQIIETGLVKLYRATGKRKYLNLAKFFLDQRGNAEGHDLNGSYNQDHIPVIDQKEAVGHAVRATYMYAGMADIAALTGDEAYLHAVDAIWDNVVNKKIYITGGLGARHDGESFGENYELPNLTAYNETCAAIGSIYWNYRMFLLHGDAKYIDVLERTLYNGMLAGVSMDGRAFFYPNCLASDGNYGFNQGALTRRPWFDCSCCPTNVIRFIPSVAGYMFAKKDDAVYVNLYIDGQAEFDLGKSRLSLRQETNYPWDGHVRIHVGTDSNARFRLMLRIPCWTADRPLPGDLYRFADVPEETVVISVNGSPVQMQQEPGYAILDRIWKSGDIVDLMLPMQVRRVIADSRVRDDSARVALIRGPLTYCLEQADNGPVDSIRIPENAEFEAEYRPDLLNGVMILQQFSDDPQKMEAETTAIPYYAWSHRGPGEMAVWLPSAP